MSPRRSKLAKAMEEARKLRERPERETALARENEALRAALAKEQAAVVNLCSQVLERDSALDGMRALLIRASEQLAKAGQ